MWRSNQLSYETIRSWEPIYDLINPDAVPNGMCSLSVHPFSKAEASEVVIPPTFVGCSHLAFHSCKCSRAARSQSSRKEVFQPHLPVRLPCYDLAPVTSFTLGRSLRSRTLGTPSFHGLTGGVYKARERIHRAMADARLLANPASRSRVADSDPN